MDIQKIRRDFPILDKEIDGKKVIYLDSACVTLRPKQVIDKINEYYYEYPGCAGRSVHKIGTKVTIEINEARNKVQRFINAAEENEVVFVRNTTEGMNIVASGLSLAKGDRVLTTDREHNSNLVPWLYLQKQKGFDFGVVPSNSDNTFNLETFENMMDKKVKIVSMVHTSNLDGYTIPAEEIIKIAHDHDALVMLDGAQSTPHNNIDVQQLDVDFFAFSAHKMCGPSGVGVLYGKQPLLNDLSPLIVGGSTVKNTTYSSIEFLDAPERFEAGLQNYAGIIGTGAAVDYLKNIGPDEIMRNDCKLNKIISDSLLALDEISVIGPMDPKLRGCAFSFNIKNIDCHNVAMILDEIGNISIRSGMHCVHSWFNEHNINGSARATVYFYNTEDEVRFFAEKVEEIIKNFN